MAFTPRSRLTSWHEPSNARFPKSDDVLKVMYMRSRQTTFICPCDDWNAYAVLEQRRIQKNAWTSEALTVMKSRQITDDFSVAMWNCFQAHNKWWDILWTTLFLWITNCEENVSLRNWTKPLTQSTAFHLKEMASFHHGSPFGVVFIKHCPDRALGTLGASLSFLIHKMWCILKQTDWMDPSDQQVVIFSLRHTGSNGAPSLPKVWSFFGYCGCESGMKVPSHHPSSAKT